MFLEDLVVSPDHRGRGAGMKLLRSLAEVAQARGCHRLAWQVLDWYAVGCMFPLVLSFITHQFSLKNSGMLTSSCRNEPAIKFYSRIGAQLLKEWIPVRLTKEGIDEFLASFPGPNPHSVLAERP